MQHYIEKLQSIRDRALRLSSFSPGQGYDDIGTELSEFVVNSGLQYPVRQELFTMLETQGGLLKNLQEMSVSSEIDMEIFYANQIIDCLAEQPVQAQHDIEPAQALSRLLTCYPYDWSSARIKEEIRLLQNHAHIDFVDGRFVYLGRSALPFSALEMHYTTGTKYTWYDTHKGCADVAKKFVAQLVRHGLLSPDAIEVHYCDDYAKALHAHQGKIAVVFLQEGAQKQSVYHEIYARGIPFIRSEILGMVKLLYPFHVSEAVNAEQYEKKAVVLARHAQDEPHEFHVQYVPDHNRLYLSVGLYVPQM